MKRSILALVLALATVLALAACGRGDKAAASVQPTADTAKKAEDITLCPTYDNGKGGFLFMLEVFPTDYDYTELPEYQAICGLTVDGANYNLIAELPTDVQFANENADLYRSMSNDFSTILKSLTFSKGVTRTEVTAPVPSTGSGS